MDSSPSSGSKGTIKSAESITADFSVSTAGSTFSGTFLMPDGTAISSDNRYGVWVDIWSEMGFGNSAPIGTDGTFSIKVASGSYDVSFWIDTSISGFSQYGSPGSATIRIKDGATVDLNSTSGPFKDVLIDNPAGDKALSFKTLDSRITGTAKASDGSAMANVAIYAWSENGDWGDATTDKDGAYTMYVATGKWEIVAEPGSSSAYGSQAPVKTKVVSGQASTVNFAFASAGHTVTGAVRDSSGTLVSNLFAWAYARTDNADSNGEDTTFDIITDTYVENGEFTLRLPNGDYKVGLWIGPESGYSMSAEVDADLSSSGDTSSSKVTITVAANDKKISGHLVDSSGNVVTGVEGDVFAIMGGDRGSTWVDATINKEDGSYSLSLTGGNWDMGYYLDLATDSSYSPFPNETQISDLRGIDTSSASVVKNITLSTLGGSISGTVTVSGSTVSDEVDVYVNRVMSSSSTPPYYDVVETSSGAYSFKLENGYKYELGVYLEHGSNYAEPAVTEVDLTSASTASGIALALGSNDSTIAGTVKLDGSAVSDTVFVYAWSSKGQDVYVESNSSGVYSLSVPSGAIWNIGADYQSVANDGTATNYQTDNLVAVDLTSGTQNVTDTTLSVTRQTFSLPKSVTDTFTVSKGYSKVLDDGSQIDIPADAVPGSDKSRTVTIKISPVTTGLSDTSTTKTMGDFAYSFELLESDGKRISKDFTKDVILTMNYIGFGQTGTEFASEDEEGDIKVSFYSTTNGAWEEAKSVTVDKVANKIFATVTHFSSYSVTGQQSSNSSPTLSGLTAKTVAENAAASVIDSAVAFADSDGGNLNTGTITVSALDGQDVVSLPTGVSHSSGVIRRDGNDVQVSNGSSWTTIGTIGTGSGTTGSGETLVITFSSDSATPTVVDTLLQTLTFYNNDDTPTTSRTLSITVTDGDGGTTSAQTVVMSVTAVNDAPSISSSTFTIAENASVGAAVGTKTGTDVDGDTLTYTITAGNDGGLFAINSGSGAITVASGLNHETASSHSLTVQAADAALSATATVTVTVGDVNEVPSISASTYTIAENASVGATVGTKTGTDVDDDTLAYTITAGNDGGLFANHWSNSSQTILHRYPP